MANKQNMNYLEATDYKYCLAFQQLSNPNLKGSFFKYYGYNEWTDFISQYNNANLKQFFEVCKSKNRRLYFDIDKLNIPFSDFNEIDIIDNINTFIKNNTDYTGNLDYCYFYCVDVNNNINSIHIIYKEVIISYEDNKDLATALNEISDELQKYKQDDYKNDDFFDCLI